MNLPALQTFIAAGESVTLELKKSTDQKDRSCRSLCALGQTPGQTTDLILGWITNTPGAFIPELVQQLGKSESAVQRSIRTLRASGKLLRTGHVKGGHWKMME